MNITQEELIERVKLHRAWLADESGGARFICKRREDFSEAILRGADLSRADLSGAILRGADLSGADLSGADLREAILSEAILSGADLSEAILRGAILSGADLSRADLREADLREAILSGADLSKTSLDPENTNLARALYRRFAAGRRGGMIAYRTAASPYVGDAKYHPGTHIASGLSWSVETDCHPGIYFADLDWLRGHFRGPFVRVYIRAGEWVPTPGKGGLVGRAARVRVLGAAE